MRILLRITSEIKTKIMAKKKNKVGAKKKPIGEVKHRVVVFIELDRITARGGEEAMKKHLYESA